MTTTTAMTKLVCAECRHENEAERIYCHNCGECLDRSAVSTQKKAQRDLARKKKFFSALFGWSFVDYGPDYASFDDGRMTGGFFGSEKNASVDPGAPLIVFYHPELEETHEKVVNLGGEITK